MYRRDQRVKGTRRSTEYISVSRLDCGICFISTFSPFTGASTQNFPLRFFLFFFSFNCSTVCTFQVMRRRPPECVERVVVPDSLVVKVTGLLNWLPWPTLV